MAAGTSNFHIVSIARKTSMSTKSDTLQFPQEKLSAQDAEVQGALLIFRGDEQLSMLEVCGQAEELSRSFHESADIIWMIIECHEQSVTALLATSLTDQGFRSRDEL